MCQQFCGQRLTAVEYNFVSVQRRQSPIAFKIVLIKSLQLCVTGLNDIAAQHMAHFLGKDVVNPGIIIQAHFQRFLNQNLLLDKSGGEVFPLLLAEGLTGRHLLHEQTSIYVGLVQFQQHGLGSVVQPIDGKNDQGHQEEMRQRLSHKPSDRVGSCVFAHRFVSFRLVILCGRRHTL